MGGRIMKAVANDPYLSKRFVQAKPVKQSSSRASIHGMPFWLHDRLAASITDREIDAVCRRDYNVVSTNYGFRSAFLAKSEHARGKL